MNLYSWPFAAPGITGDIGLYWTATLSLIGSIERYAMFYVATSLVHDATRSVAAVLLILFAGGPVIRTLQRFHTGATWSASLPG